MILWNLPGRQAFIVVKLQDVVLYCLPHKPQGIVIFNLAWNPFSLLSHESKLCRFFKLCGFNEPTSVAAMAW
ncbi:hypothetical protein SLEP1_g16940 [Rubroshorea leprosula]|uniref:Uncharacterized protein n=1 Tax=Rubroshorea leprosula TaxID=152421 RepID=A0AAV5J458_9ROSI|nr:hypothetical protein SLEP1_g16940 [Rubroshorea leprosula]